VRLSDDFHPWWFQLAPARREPLAASRKPGSVYPDPIGYFTMSVAVAERVVPAKVAATFTV
jgi:hypothetical protein